MNKLLQASILAKGDTGNAATVSVGTVTTGDAGSSAAVTNAGTSHAAVLNFTIPKGADGATGAYIGTTAPTGGQIVWVDTTGGSSSAEALHNDIVTSGVYIGETAPVTQTRIWVDTSAGSSMSQIAQYTEQANTAKTLAQSAKTDAETARTGAELAETNANTAKTAAETAQTGAEAAYSGVQSIANTKVTKPTLVTSGVTQSLALVAQPNTRYTYGELTSFVLSFANGTTAYDDIHIMWESGATATVMSIDASNALVPSFTPGANQICELDAVWNAVKSKWIVKGAQQPNANE